MAPRADSPLASGPTSRPRPRAPTAFVLSMASRDDRDEDTVRPRAVPAPPLTRRQKRIRRLVTVLLIAGLVGGLALSTVKQSTPSGSASSMAGMDMSGGAARVSVRLRDVDGRPMELPGGSAGAVLFMARRGCPDCPGVAQRLVRAARDLSPSPAITLVGIDPVETASDFRAFDRAAGGLGVRYVLDDRGRSVAQQLGAREVGAIVVYDRRGMIRRRLEPGPRQAAEIDRVLHRR